jgi:prophage regulatory protein
MTDIRPMIRMKSLARLIGVDRATIYRWMKAGTFPQPVNVGEHAMSFYEDEVIEWQKQREEQSLAPPRRQIEPLKPRVGFRSPRRRS